MERDMVDRLKSIENGPIGEEIIRQSKKTNMESANVTIFLAIVS